MSAETSIIDRPIIGSNLTFPDLSSFRKKGFLPDILSIDNERTNTDIPILKPLSDAKDSNGHPIQTDELKQFFSYLSCTRQLEAGTAKTEYLQKIADRMTEGTNIKSRVVVMRKGKEAEAFCTEDGTIFLSQSIINKLDNVDEIAAVIAHETNHLRNHTFQLTEQTRNKFGAAWVHEAVADVQVPELLEKAGFNSLAFASAIEKLSGFGRDIEHQSGVARASQNIGTHFGIDRRTSSQTPILKPDMLHEEEQPTNMELFTNAHRAKDREKAAKIAETLHPEDLIKAYKKLSELQEWEKIKAHRENKSVIKEDEGEIALQSKIASEIKNILAQYEATEDEQTIIQMCIGQEESLYHEDSIRRFSEIKNPYKIYDLARLISKGEEIESLNAFSERAGFGKLVTGALFRIALKNNLVDLHNTPGARGIPVNEESLLDVIETISKGKDEDVYRSFCGNGKIISEYILRANVKPYQGNVTNFPFEETKIRAFLEKVKQRKILNAEDRISLGKDIVEGGYFDDHAGKTYLSSWTFNNANANKLSELVSEILQQNPFAEKNVELFFQDLKNSSSENAQWNLDNLLLQSVNWLDENKEKVTDDEKLLIALKIMNELRTDTRLNTDNQLLQNGIRVGALFFERDSEQFYAFMENITPSDVVSKLSPKLAFSFSAPLLNEERGLSVFNESGHSMHKYMLVIQNFERFSKLPIVQLALKYSFTGEESVKSFSQFLEVMRVKKLYEWNNPIIRIQKLFFEDNPESLIPGQEYRKKLLELMQNKISNSDFIALHDCLELMYPDGPEKTHFLRQINKRVLTSKDIFFENKLLYLDKNIDELGFDGLSILADEIEDINIYEKFRIRMQSYINEYLSGKQVTLKTAGIDFASSFFAKDFRKLFDSCRSDPDFQIKSSTDFARTCINDVTMGTAQGGLGANYDINTDKLLMSASGRQRFRTVSELVDILHSLTPFERFAAVHKALTEKNGAFSDGKNRQILSHQVIDSLEIKNRFIEEAIKSVCQEGDAKFLTFPLSKMLSPLLFRSLNKEKIDRKRIADIKVSTGKDVVDRDGRKHREYVKIKDLAPENNIIKSLSHGRRDVSGFGSQYKEYPDTPFFRLSKESDDQFQELTQRLHEMLDEPKQNEKESKTAEIDPSMDAIVKGVEGSGALGVRSLQLAVQMHEFSEPVRKRLSESFDSNPGLNKLLFWENLHKLSEENPEVREFVQKLRLKGYLGGGSLYTTFEALIDDGDKERQIALKMLNPNSEAFLKESRGMAQIVLSEVRKKGGETRKLADMGLVLTDLAHQWCLKDINDKTFIEDDDRFKKVIEGFNAREGKAEYTIPERVFNTYNLKAEDLALGKTVNKVLNDEEVSDKTKQTLIKRMSEFFVLQLKGPKIQEEGENYALVHSDPHVGNYIVDIKNPDMPIAVIDRHMYLKLENQDISVLEQFIAGNDLKFLLALTERVLEINKVANRIERTVTATRVNSALMKNYFSQKSEGKVDKFSLLRAALSEFQKRGLDVPLNLRLMIRNIQALKNLTSKYGLNFEKIYKNFKP